MDRIERAGVGIALAGHAALLALLSLRLAQPAPPPSVEHPIAVSLVEDVALTQTAPPAPEPPSASEAPEQGAPEDAAPPPAPAPEPKPAPPPPEPVARPKPEPAPKPQPVPKPQPLAKPAPAERAAPRPAAEAKPAPAKPTAAKPAPAKPARPDADRLASVVADATRAGQGRGSGGAGTAARPRGSRLSSDFLKGLSDGPSKAAPSAAAPGAAMSARAAADIGSAILRQVQPCADRQVNPGPGAERIRVAVNLRLNRDGSLAAPPRVAGHDGVDDANRRYLARVDDLAIATFSGCAPLRGLPADLYDVANGWRSFTLRYKLPG